MLYFGPRKYREHHRQLQKYKSLTKNYCRHNAKCSPDLSYQIADGEARINER